MRMAADNASEHLCYRRAFRPRRRALQELASLMELPSPPEWVELRYLADGASAPYAAWQYRQGACQIKYKRFKISAFRGGDVDCLREAFSRRIERFRAGDEGFLPLPDCVIADGGQAHAYAAPSPPSGLDIPVFGLKGLRHRTKSLVLPDGREFFV